MIGNCHNCKAEIDRSPSKFKGRLYIFCSRSCHFASQKGMTSPRKNQIKAVCLECKSNFYIQQYRLDTAKFCSKTCHYKNRDNGITTANEKIRKSSAYKKWRTAVFERDNYTCMECHKHGGSLQADHIKPFALFTELRLDLNNGRTLCMECHKKTDTYGRVGIFRNITGIGRQA